MCPCITRRWCHGRERLGRPAAPRRVDRDRRAGGRAADGPALAPDPRRRRDRLRPGRGALARLARGADHAGRGRGRRRPGVPSRRYTGYRLLLVAVVVLVLASWHFWEHYHLRDRAPRACSWS